MSAGVSIQYRLPDGVLQAHLNALANWNTRQVSIDIGEYMIGQVQDRFDQQKLWDGTAMTQSGAAKARDGQTLIDNRLLYKSYVYNPVSDGVEVGSASPYARIHHLGGETGRIGARFNMTARPVMGINDQDNTKIGDIILNDLRSLS